MKNERMEEGRQSLLHPVAVLFRPVLKVVLVAYG